MARGSSISLALTVSTTLGAGAMRLGSAMLAARTFAFSRDLLIASSACSGFVKHTVASAPSFRTLNT